MTDRSGRKQLKLGSVFMTLALGAGFVASTRLATAETGASVESGDLANLLEEKLDGVRRAPGFETSAPSATKMVAPTGDEPIAVATEIAFAALGIAGAIFLAALWIKRRKERRFGDALGTNLTVKESVWIGRGQRILLVAFENHKLLVGVSGGALHSLGSFDEKGESVQVSSPIERAAAMRSAEERSTAEFSEFVKGELAGSLAARPGPGRDRRQKMITELNTL